MSLARRHAVRASLLEGLEARSLFAIEYTLQMLGSASQNGTTAGQDISADGSTVAASVVINSGTSYGYIWSNGKWNIVAANAVGATNDDGSVFAGGIDATTPATAVRIASGKVQNLGYLPGGTTSYVSAISGDGSVVVGSSSSSATTGTRQLAYRWTSSGGMQSLGDLPGGNVSSIAYDVTRDGNIVVGFSEGTGGNLPFRWTAGGGMVALDDLPGGSNYGVANAVSDNGNIIVGTSSNASYTQTATIWNANGDASVLDPNTKYSEARDITGDGLTIVGQTNNAPEGQRGFRWKSGTSAVDLNTLVTLPSGWVIKDALAIAKDSGHILVRIQNASNVSEPAILVPNFASVSNGVLSVAGTGGNDSITIKTTGSNVVVTRGSASQSFAASGVNRVNVDAGGGDDRVDALGFAKSLYISGGPGDDTLIAGASNDTLTGGAGRNRLYGGDGKDRLNGSAGRDFLNGENDDDRLYGNGGNDYMDGGGGKDRLWGGDGEDFLYGGASVDRLYGDAGNDSLNGAKGNDYLFGGDGTDTHIAAEAGDIVDSVEATA